MCSKILYLSKFTVVQINFSAAFDRVSHSGLFYKLRDVGVGGGVFDVITGFFSNRVQRNVVDGIRSENVRVVSSVSQGSVLDPLLFLPHAFADNSREYTCG